MERRLRDGVAPALELDAECPLCAKNSVKALAPNRPIKEAMQCSKFSLFSLLLEYVAAGCIAEHGEARFQGSHLRWRHYFT